MWGRQTTIDESLFRDFLKRKYAEYISVLEKRLKIIKEIEGYLYKKMETRAASISLKAQLNLSIEELDKIRADVLAAETKYL